MPLTTEPVIEVPRVVGEEQIRFFVDNGYLIVPNLVSTSEIEELREDAVRGVLTAAGDLNLRVYGVTASPLPGPAGNAEYFAWLRRGEPLGREPLTELIQTAVREGPQ